MSRDFNSFRRWVGEFVANYKKSSFEGVPFSQIHESLPRELRDSGLELRFVLDTMAQGGDLHYSSGYYLPGKATNSPIREATPQQ